MTSDVWNWYTETLPARFRAPAWKHECFDLYAHMSGRNKIADDEADIQRLFDAYDRAPIVAGARDWADKNGIRFMVDYNEDCKPGGYYYQGNPVVAVANRWMNQPAVAVTLLVHELCHARQDTLGILADLTQDFLSAYINLAFTEAAAHGAQKTAEAQINLLRDGCDPREAPGMWTPFTEWYGPQLHIFGNMCADMPTHYGAPLAQEYGVYWRIRGAKAPEDGAAFMPSSTRDYPKELRTLEEEFQLLDTDFAGRPWFDKKAAPAFMEKALDPRNAARFYNSKDIDPMVRKIMRREQDHRDGLTPEEIIERNLREAVAETAVFKFGLPR